MSATLLPATGECEKGRGERVRKRCGRECGAQMESADAVGAAALDVAAVDVAAAPLGLVLEFRLVAPATVVEIKCSHVGFVFLSAFAALAMCLKGPKSHQKKKN